MNKNINFHHLAHNLRDIQPIFRFTHRHYISCYVFFFTIFQMMSSLIRVPCMYGNNNLAKLGESQCVCHTVRSLEDVSGQWQCKVSVPCITCAHAPVSSCRGQNWGPPEAGLSTDALADVTAVHAWVDARLGGGALLFPLLGEKEAEGQCCWQWWSKWRSGRQTEAHQKKSPSLTTFGCVSF